MKPSALRHIRANEPSKSSEVTARFGIVVHIVKSGLEEEVRSAPESAGYEVLALTNSVK
jgi:hypothetical protein